MARYNKSRWRSSTPATTEREPAFIESQEVKMVHGDECRINRYDSMDAFLDVAANGTGHHSGIHGWSEPCSLKDAIAYVRRGASESDAVYRSAVSLIEKVDHAAHDRTMQAWTPSVAGAYPIVPDYLAGAPDCMRVRSAVTSDVSPIRVCVETMVSGGISERTIAAQGAAVAALVMKMSETRPVELYTTWANNQTMDDGPISAGMIKLGVNPISLAQCIAVFATRHFKRNIWFEHFRMVIGPGRLTGGWIRGMYDGWDKREQRIREILDLAPQDILLQGGALVDGELMGRDPVAWVNRQLEKQRKLED